MNAFEKAIVYDTLVFVGLDSVLSLGTLLVNLILLCADEGAFVHIGVDFYVGVVAELEGVLGGSALGSAWW